MTFCIIAVIAIALLHVAGVIDTSRRFNKLETRISQLGQAFLQAILESRLKNPTTQKATTGIPRSKCPNFLYNLLTPP